MELNKIQAIYDYKDNYDISEIPEDFQSLKEKIKELYHMDDAQLNIIKISYEDEGTKFIIKEERDFQKAKLITEQIIFKIEDIVGEEDDIIKEEQSFMDHESAMRLYTSLNNFDEKNFFNEKIYEGSNKEKKDVKNKIEDNHYFREMLKKTGINDNYLDYRKYFDDIYVNLFEIKLKKDIILYEYPFTLFSEVEPGLYPPKKIFKFCKKKLRAIYGECLIENNSLFAFNKVEELKTVNKVIRGKKGRIEFKFDFAKYVGSKIIKNADIQKDDSFVKEYLELLIKDILHANKNLVNYKRLFVK